MLKWVGIVLAAAAIAVLISLCQDRSHVLKEQPATATAGRTVASYRGRASIIVLGVRRHIPVMIDINPWSQGFFTGVITIQAAQIVTVPLTGKYTKDNITGSGSVPDGSLSLSIYAKRSGNSIIGTYQATASNYRQYNLDSRVCLVTLVSSF